MSIMVNPEELVGNGEEQSTKVLDCSEIIDPHCTASNPYTVTFQDITSAAFLIRKGIDRTPCTVCLSFDSSDTCQNAHSQLLTFIFVESQNVKRTQHGYLYEEGIFAAYRKVRNT